MSEHTSKDSAAEVDYRLSHLQRGTTYDSFLSANCFDAYMALCEADVLSQLVPALFDRPPKYIDFACGTGRITQIVAPYCTSARGIDVSETMLSEARRKCPHVQFMHVDVTQSNSDIEPVQLITAFRFFGNADDQLRHAALRAINRLLSTGGFFILNNHRNPHGLAAMLARLRGASHEMDLTYFKLRRLLKRHGFEVVQRRPIAFWMYRSKLMNSANYAEPRARRLETLFRSPWLSMFAPDAIIVAKKVRSAS